MGSLSIANNFRSAKVTTGNAWQYQGMRTFDDDAQVCPTRSNVSDSGVIDVARDSINTLAPGCFSALNRMMVENVQRPRYSPYLNASAINYPGVGDSDLPAPDEQYSSSKPFYDTQLGYQYVRPVQDSQIMRPEYKMSSFKAVGPVSEQDKETQYVGCFMKRAGENRDCLSTQ